MNIILIVITTSGRQFTRDEYLSNKTHYFLLTDTQNENAYELLWYFIIDLNYEHCTCVTYEYINDYTLTQHGTPNTSI